MKELAKQLYQLRDAYEEKDRILRRKEILFAEDIEVIDFDDYDDDVDCLEKIDDDDCLERIDEEEIKNKYRKELDYPTEPEEPSVKFPDKVYSMREPFFLPKGAKESPKIIKFRKFKRECIHANKNHFRSYIGFKLNTIRVILWMFFGPMAVNTVVAIIAMIIGIDFNLDNVSVKFLLIYWVCLLALPFAIKAIVALIKAMRESHKKRGLIPRYYSEYKSYVNDYHNRYIPQHAQYEIDYDVALTKLNKKKFDYNLEKEKYDAEVAALEVIVEEKTKAEIARIVTENEKVIEAAIEKIKAENKKIMNENDKLDRLAEETYNKMIVGNPLAKDFPEKYVRAIGQLAELIEDCRANTLADAINLYEEIKFRNDKIEEERERTRYEKERLEIAREALEADEEERRYREMADEEERRYRERAADEARRDRERAADEARRDRERAENERKYEAEREKENARMQCMSCRYYSNCYKKNSITHDCASYMPR